MSETLERQRAAAVSFGPRRLGHANLFVSALERSMAFYNKVAGLEEVRREPGIAAGFLTNGNTHHDVGMIQVTTEARTGVGGHMQIPRGRGKEPGLNHLGWEMENEAELVAAYRRALEAGVRIHRRANHQISHSIYVFDPDGNLNEFYADALKDWRSIFNPSRDDLVTSEWEVDTIAEPDREPKYDTNPDLRKVPDAVLHPLRIASAVRVARNYPRMVDFYHEVGGLTPRRIQGRPEASVLAGKLGRPDLVIFPKADGLEAGLHHVTFELALESDIASASDRLRSAGVAIELEIDNEDKRSLFLRDPDGLRLEFCCRRREGIGSFAGQPKHLAPFYV
jgi:catechol 2,3-dioxygenase